jgi:hypothetical protein
MDPTIKKYLLSFELGETQHFKNMGIIPILSSLNHEPEYLTLKEALEEGALIVTEVSQEGSVPELKVKNKGSLPVLLMDGEELTGAKQNRVLNTTILVKDKSELIIPVSCTEQGRWAYTAREFSDSGTVMTPKLRMMKSKTVSHTLENSQQYRSDQGTVWTAISEMEDRADTRSETGAMKDVFAAKIKDIDEYMKTFSIVPHQRGLLVFINEEIVGFDFISYEKALEILHAKLVKSYAMEALLQEKTKEKLLSLDKVSDFQKEIQKCKEKKYRSVGIGWDYRYEGDKIVGTALKTGRKVIHMAFFRITESDKAGKMADSRTRRRFRA